jgi:signal transduction histidine kinase
MRTEAEVALRSVDLGVGEARKVIASSLEEIGRMAKMVEQMLMLARSGGVRPGTRAAFTLLDLAELVRGTSAKMARRAADLGIRLAVPAEAPAMIHGDAFTLERAVYNILENAITYTSAGGSVEVGVRRHGGHVVLSVADTGIGIPPEDLAHLGEPFYRGDRARSAHTGGAGLGLAVVKAVMQEHRGSFQALSRPVGGTTIILRFPAA